MIKTVIHRRGRLDGGTRVFPVEEDKRNAGRGREEESREVACMYIQPCIEYN